MRKTALKWSNPLHIISYSTVTGGKRWRISYSTITLSGCGGETAALKVVHGRGRLVHLGTADCGPFLGIRNASCPATWVPLLPPLPPTHTEPLWALFQCPLKPYLMITFCGVSLLPWLESFSSRSTSPPLPESPGPVWCKTNKHWLNAAIAFCIHRPVSHTVLLILFTSLLPLLCENSGDQRSFFFFY